MHVIARRLSFWAPRLFLMLVLVHALARQQGKKRKSRKKATRREAFLGYYISGIHIVMGRSHSAARSFIEVEEGSNFFNEAGWIAQTERMIFP